MSDKAESRSGSVESDRPVKSVQSGRDVPGAVNLPSGSAWRLAGRARRCALLHVSRDLAYQVAIGDVHCHLHPPLHGGFDHRSWPPQCGHSVMSISKTRLSRCAQVNGARGGSRRGASVAWARS